MVGTRRSEIAVEQRPEQSDPKKASQGGNKNQDERWRGEDKIARRMCRRGLCWELGDVCHRYARCIGDRYILDTNSSAPVGYRRKGGLFLRPHGEIACADNKKLVGQSGFLGPIDKFQKGFPGRLLIARLFLFCRFLLRHGFPLKCVTGQPGFCSALIQGTKCVGLDTSELI